MTKRAVNPSLILLYEPEDVEALVAVDASQRGNVEVHAERVETIASAGGKWAWRVDLGSARADDASIRGEDQDETSPKDELSHEDLDILEAYQAGVEAGRRPGIPKKSPFVSRRFNLVWSKGWAAGSLMREDASVGPNAVAVCEASYNEGFAAGLNGQAPRPIKSSWLDGYANGQAQRKDDASRRVAPDPITLREVWDRMKSGDSGSLVFTQGGDGGGKTLKLGGPEPVEGKRAAEEPGPTKTAFELGEDASRRGLDEDACPFYEPERQAEWMLGWKEARAQIDKAHEEAASHGSTKSFEEADLTEAAYLSGKEAAKLGLDESACSYHGAILRSEWMRGLRDGLVMRGIGVTDKEVDEMFDKAAAHAADLEQTMPWTFEDFEDDNEDDGA